MKRLLCIILGLLILITTGCNKSVIGDEKTAENYVKSLGYEITSQKGIVDKYVLDKSKLNEPRIQAWRVQNFEPDNYFGKEITVYRYIVKNHPLEKKYQTNNGTNLYIMLSESKVIGGYSFPNADLVGSLYSIDGKTLEEVTGLSYQQWAEEWAKKYGN